jgi:hypothetical protein
MRLRGRAGLSCLLSVLLGGCGPSSSPTQPTPATGAAPSVAPPAARADLKSVIEALFLGSGPLTPSDGNAACPFPGHWSGFQRGSGVRIRVSRSVSADKLAAIRDAAGQVATATRGAITATVDVVDDPDLRPAAGEVTSESDPDPVAQGCPSAVGCIMHTFVAPGVFGAGRAVQPPGQTPNAFAHDVVGHGVMGMCHVDGHLLGGAGLSLMSGGPGVFSDQIAPRLTGLDVEAAQAVYASPLDPGATRADFVRAGLIAP